MSNSTPCVASIVRDSSTISIVLFERSPPSTSNTFISPRLLSRLQRCRPILVITVRTSGNASNRSEKPRNVSAVSYNCVPAGSVALTRYSPLSLAGKNSDSMERNKNIDPPKISTTAIATRYFLSSSQNSTFP